MSFFVAASIALSCSHSAAEHLFTNPFCSQRSQVQKITAVVFHQVTLGVPLATYYTFQSQSSTATLLKKVCVSYVVVSAVSAIGYLAYNYFYSTAE